MWGVFFKKTHKGHFWNDGSIEIQRKWGEKFANNRTQFTASTNMAKTLDKRHV